MKNISDYILAVGSRKIDTVLVADNEQMHIAIQRVRDSISVRAREPIEVTQVTNAALGDPKRMVQRLHEVALLGTGLDPALMDFVSRLGERQVNKLVAHGILNAEAFHLSRSVEQHVEDFLGAHAHWKPSHAGNMRRNLSDAIEVLQARRLTDFAPERVGPDLDAMMPERSACTRNHRLRDIKQFLDWWVKHERLSKHRLHLIHKANEHLDQRRAKRPFTREEFDRLLETSPRNRGRVYLFGILTGFRRNEIKTLRWYDVDLSGAAVALPGRNAKGGHDDTLPLHAQLHEVLCEMHEEQDNPAAGEWVFPTMPSDRTWKRDLKRRVDLRG